MRHAAWKRPLLLAVTIAPLVGLCPALANAQPGGARPAAAEPDDASVKKATAAFKKGDELFGKKKYALALEAFKESYAAVPSPNSHLYIARCLRELGDARAAYLEFTKVMDEAEARKDKYGATGDSAKIERDKVSAKLAVVTISVTGAGPNSTVHIGTELVPRDQWEKPIPLPAGTVDATLENNGQQVAKQTLNLSAGDKKTISLEPSLGSGVNPPGGGPGTGGPGLGAGGSDPGGGDTGGGGTPKSKMPPLRIAGIALGGVGVFGFGMFAIAGAMSKSTYSDLESRCPVAMRPCSGLSDDISKGKSQQTAANVGLVMGIVGVAGGATLIALSFRKSKADPKPAEVMISPGYASVKGRF